MKYKVFLEAAFEGDVDREAHGSPFEDEDEAHEAGRQVKRAHPHRTVVVEAITKGAESGRRTKVRLKREVA